MNQVKQIKFRVDDDIYGGLKLGANKVICGCCGSILDLDDVEIITEYDHWVDLSQEIIG